MGWDRMGCCAFMEFECKQLSQTSVSNMCPSHEPHVIFLLLLHDDVITYEKRHHCSASSSSLLKHCDQMQEQEQENSSHGMPISNYKRSLFQRRNVCKKPALSLAWILLNFWAWIDLKDVFGKFEDDLKGKITQEEKSQTSSSSSPSPSLCEQMDSLFYTKKDKEGASSSSTAPTGTGASSLLSSLSLRKPLKDLVSGSRRKDSLKDKEPPQLTAAPSASSQSALPAANTAAGKTGATGAAAGVRTGGTGGESWHAFLSKKPTKIMAMSGGTAASGVVTQVMSTTRLEQAVKTWRILGHLKDVGRKIFVKHSCGNWRNLCDSWHLDSLLCVCWCKFVLLLLDFVSVWAVWAGAAGSTLAERAPPSSQSRVRPPHFVSSFGVPY